MFRARDKLESLHFSCGVGLGCVWVVGLGGAPPALAALMSSLVLVRSATIHAAGSSSSTIITHERSRAHLPY